MLIAFKTCLLNESESMVMCQLVNNHVVYVTIIIAWDITRMCESYNIVSYKIVCPD